MPGEPVFKQIGESLAVSRLRDALDIRVPVFVLDSAHDFARALGCILQADHGRIADLVPAERPALASAGLIANESRPLAAGTDVEHKPVTPSIRYWVRLPSKGLAVAI
jgi:hypothetical protein